MKRTNQSILMVPVILVLAACGGGSNNNPPPPPSSPSVSQADLQKLMSLSQNAQQVCCQSAAPYMISVGRALYTPSSQSIAGAIPQPDMGGCQTAVMNFQMDFTTLGNGSYAQQPSAQAWRQSQGANVVNCVGAQMQAAGLPVTPATLPLYFAAAQGLTQSLQNAVPGLGIPAYQAQSAVGGAVGGYAGGLGYGIAGAVGASSYGLGANLNSGYPSLSGSAVANNPYAVGGGLSSSYGLTANPYATGTTGYGLGANPYATTGANPYGYQSQLGAFPYSTYGTNNQYTTAANPYGATANPYTSGTQQLASTYGAPNFLDPNASGQIFNTLPNIPTGF